MSRHAMSPMESLRRNPGLGTAALIGLLCGGITMVGVPRAAYAQSDDELPDGDGDLPDGDDEPTPPKRKAPPPAAKPAPQPAPARKAPPRAPEPPPEDEELPPPPSVEDEDVLSTVPAKKQPARVTPEEPRGESRKAGRKGTTNNTVVLPGEPEEEDAPPPPARRTTKARYSDPEDDLPAATGPDEGDPPPAKPRQNYRGAVGQVDQGQDIPPILRSPLLYAAVGGAGVAGVVVLAVAATVMVLAVVVILTAVAAPSLAEQLRSLIPGSNKEGKVRVKVN